jgi:UDP-2-acetamido-2,6-beta-L-arabino-hexul-4-ose reductase
MNILITGATGFIGNNLTERLARKPNTLMLTYDPRTDKESLSELCALCDFVFYLAAVHRPRDISEFDKVNVSYFAELLRMLRHQGNTCPVLFTSSYQAVDDTPYGKSKWEAEEELLGHAAINQSEAIIYRLTNTFGRYARPNQHSVVATFCHNLARGLPIEIHEPERIMRLYYIDDVIKAFLSHSDDYVKPDKDGFFRLPESLTYEITLQDLAGLITGFKADYDRGIRTVPTDDLAAKLFATFLSYIP